MLMKVKGGN